MGPILVLMTLQIGQMITVEATVSFLGLSVPPPTPTWGNMLSGPARTHMIRAPWMALWPGLALSMTVYFVNILGDAIRDILDPKLRGSVGRYGKIAVHKNSKGRTMGKEVLGKIVRK
jgi:peptide/nickel transport system permease protein